MRFWPHAPLLAAVAVLPRAPAGDPYPEARDRMVRTQIEARGIHHPAVLRVLRTTPRHLFVPPPLREVAYEDRALPIGYGATISQPFVVAWMTEILAAGRNDRVLEIGAGSGYQAAVLSQLASHVYTIEIVPELARAARETLRRLDYRNVTVREGDGYKGWPEEAPFDRIIVTAAPPSIPSDLTDQLKTGGRLVAPVGPGWDQELILVEKGGDGALHRKSLGAVAFVPMRPGKD